MDAADASADGFGMPFPFPFPFPFRGWAVTLRPCQVHRSVLLSPLPCGL